METQPDLSNINKRRRKRAKDDKLEDKFNWEDDGDILGIIEGGTVESRDVDGLNVHEFLSLIGRRVFIKGKAGQGQLGSNSTLGNGDCGYTAVAQVLMLQRMNEQDRQEFYEIWKEKTRQERIKWGVEEGLKLRNKFADELNVQHKETYDLIQKGNPSLIIRWENKELHRLSADRETREEIIKSYSKEEQEEIREKILNEELEKKNKKLWFGILQAQLLASILDTTICIINITLADGRVACWTTYRKTLGYSCSYRYEDKERNYYFIPEECFNASTVVIIYDSTNHFWLSALDIPCNMNEVDFLKSKKDGWANHESNLETTDLKYIFRNKSKSVTDRMKAELGHGICRRKT